jgi:hypothetical protein
VEIIPGGYTYVLQPCDVGINRPLKNGIRNQHNDWAILKMDANVPAPAREDIIRWLVSSWENIESATIVKIFASIGYGVPESTASVEQQASAEVSEEPDHDVDLTDLVLHITL